MPNKLFKKGLVVGIILLFIGLAFIPSFDAVSINKDVKETNKVVDDIEKDCFECQTNGKTHLAEKLLNRLEKNEVLSNIIDSDNPAFERPICILLNNTFWRLMDLVHSLEYMLDTLPKDSMLFDIISLYAYIIAMGIVPYIATMIEKLNCW